MLGTSRLGHVGSHCWRQGHYRTPASLSGEGTDLVALSLHVCEWFFVPTEKGFQRLRDGSLGVMCVRAWGGGRDREG